MMIFRKLFRMKKIVEIILRQYFWAQAEIFLEYFLFKTLRNTLLYTCKGSRTLTTKPQIT